MKTSEWLQALRSGNFQQTKHRLSDGAGGFCCLGVLCEVKGLQKKIESDDVADTGVRVTYIFNPDVGPDQVGQDGPSVDTNGTSTAMIPVRYLDTVLEDLKLSRTVDDPFLGGQDALDSILMTMNDEGKTFAEIADFIEAQL
jgi:hypothetical protein